MSPPVAMSMLWGGPGSVETGKLSEGAAPVVVTGAETPGGITPATPAPDTADRFEEPLVSGAGVDGSVVVLEGRDGATDEVGEETLSAGVVGGRFVR